MVTLTLDQIQRGASVEIVALPPGQMRAQALRFGIGEGTRVECTEHIPAGPVVVRKRHQEIAIGHSLAQSIQVKPLPAETAERMKDKCIVTV